MHCSVCACFGSNEARALLAEHGLENGRRGLPVVLAFARRTELTDENWGAAS
jgi:hypothetical protein